MNRTAVCTIAAILALLSSRLDAALIAAESFLRGTDRAAGQYTVENIASANNTGANASTVLGWPTSPGYTSSFSVGGVPSGTTGAFTVSNVALSSSLVSYDDGATQGSLNVAAVTGDTSVRSVVRPLSPVPSSSVWWFSIMVNRPAAWAAAGTSTGFVGGGILTDSANAAGFSIGLSGAGDGVPDLAIRSVGPQGTAPTPPNITIDTIGSVTNITDTATRLVIARLTLDVTGPETIDLWVDPSDTSSAAALGPALTSLSREFAVTLNPFLSTRFSAIGATGQTRFDEYRLATTFEAVIPEPTSAFLALGFIGSACAGPRRGRAPVSG
jgi:hypothetical protein